MIYCKENEVNKFHGWMDFLLLKKCYWMNKIFKGNFSVLLMINELF